MDVTRGGEPLQLGERAPRFCDPAGHQLRLRGMSAVRTREASSGARILTTTLRWCLRSWARWTTWPPRPSSRRSCSARPARTDVLDVPRHSFSPIRVNRRSNRGSARSGSQ